MTIDEYGKLMGLSPQQIEARKWRLHWLKLGLAGGCVDGERIDRVAQRQRENAEAIRSYETKRESV